MNMFKYMIRMSIVIFAFLIHISGEIQPVFCAQTQEYVYLGMYPQSKVQNVTREIMEAEYDQNHTAVVNGVMYIRMKGSDEQYSWKPSNGSYTWSESCDTEGYHYFIYEPVRWKVLKRVNGKVYLMSDKILDVNGYDEKWNPKKSWKQSKLYSWLHSSFLPLLFSEEEREGLLWEMVDGCDSRIWILSASEVLNEEYGFSEYNHVDTNQCRYQILSDYASTRSVSSYDYGTVKYGDWLLRAEDGRVGMVGNHGEVRMIQDDGGYGLWSGICPVIVVKEENLSFLTESIKQEDKNTEFYNRVYFGSYPTKEVLEEDIIEELSLATYDENGDTLFQGEMYRRISRKDATCFGDFSYDWSQGGDSEGYHYFRYEAICWRVLYEEDDKLLLLADKAVDSVIFDTNKGRTSYSYEDSQIRTWLNGQEGFFGGAFSKEQQTQMYVGSVLDGENPEDKVWLLSYTDVHQEMYGFTGNQGTEFDENQLEIDILRLQADQKRLAQPTAYTWCKGTNFFGYVEWWLRDTNLNQVPGTVGEVNMVNWNGSPGVPPKNDNEYSISGNSAWTTGIGVRPVICVNKAAVFSDKHEASAYNSQHYQWSYQEHAEQDYKEELEFHEQIQKDESSNLINSCIMMVGVCALLIFAVIIVEFFYTKITEKHFFLLTRKNLIYFIVNNRKFFCMMVVGQIVSFVILLFSYGQLEYALLSKGIPDVVDMLISAKFSEDEGIGPVREKLYESVEYLGDEFDTCTIYAEIPSDLENEKVVSILVNPIYYEMEFDGYMTYEQIMGKEYVARISKARTDVELGERIIIGGNEYRVVGKFNSDMPQIPIETIPETGIVNGFQIHLKYVPEKTRIEEITAKLNLLFGNQIHIEAPVGMDLMGVQQGYLMTLCSAMIMLLILLNTGISYGYILERRKNDYRIMRLLGCHRIQGYLIYMVEILLILLVCCMVGYGIFGLWGLPRMAEENPLFQSIYSMSICIELLVVYITFAVCITSVVVRKFIKSV